jgi:putative proteasome-type protease
MYLQTGEAKYGKSIMERVIDPTTTLSDTVKCVLVSFDSTMRSNLSVGMPIDLMCYERDALAVRKRRRFEQGDPYFSALSKEWSAGVRGGFWALARARVGRVRRSAGRHPEPTASFIHRRRRGS